MPVRFLQDMSGCVHCGVSWAVRPQIRLPRSMPVLASRQAMYLRQFEQAILEQAEDEP